MNCAHREARRCEMRQRAQDIANDQARERRQRRLARNDTTRFANTEPKRDDDEELRRKNALPPNAGVKRRRSRPLGRNVRQQQAAQRLANTILLLCMPGNAEAVVACAPRTNGWR
jgi:hypothetical protein